MMVEVLGDLCPPWSLDACGTRLIPPTSGVPMPTVLERNNVKISGRGREPGVRQGPRVSPAPGVGAHHEYADRLLGIHPVGQTLEPVVEPAQMQAVDRVRRLGTKVALADLLDPREMDPRTDHEMLALAGRFGATLLAHAHEVLGSA